MAITRLSERPGLGELLGTGLGSGLSSGLQSLAELKLKKMQQKQEQGNIYKSLTDANVPENVASVMANVPKSMQRGIFNTLMKMEKKKNIDSDTFRTNQQDAANLGTLDDRYNVRRKIFNYAKKSGKTKQNLSEELLKLGISPEESDFFTSNKLNDDAILYFLKKTNNNPKKAKKLAKKFGYKV